MNYIEAVKVLREALRMAADEPNIDKARVIADAVLAATENIGQDEPFAEFARKNKGGSGEFVAVHFKCDESELPDDGFLYATQQPAPQPAVSELTDDARLSPAPIDSYSQEDRAFYKFWYGHMLGELMQPPLINIDHATARYIWNAAIAPQPAKADVVAHDGLRDEVTALRIACRRALLPLAHVSQYNKMYKDSYKELSKVVDGIYEAEKIEGLHSTSADKPL